MGGAMAENLRFQEEWLKLEKLNGSIKIVTIFDSKKVETITTRRCSQYKFIGFRQVSLVIGFPFYL